MVLRSLRMVCLLLLVSFLSSASSVEPAESIAEVLKAAGLERYQGEFDDRGYDEPRLLRRMSDMDMGAMGMDAEEIVKFKEAVANLVPEVKRERSKAKELDPRVMKRRDLTYGRMYVDGSGSSFQFKKASFGGDIPLKSFEITFASNEYGCEPVSDADGSILVVMRGKCTYLEKAEAAEDSKAAVVVVVNSDDGDLFQMPAGHDLTPEEKEDLPNIPIVLVPRAAHDVLHKVGYFDIYARAVLIPLECDNDGCYPVLPSDFNILSQLDASGGKLYLDVDDTKGLEYVSSSFGVTIPEGGQLAAVDPPDACGGSLINGDDLKSAIVIIQRGKCDFTEKIKAAQQYGARLIIMIDDQEVSVLDRIGAPTDQLNEIYLPVLMISKSSGDTIKKAIADKEESGVPVSMTITKERSVAVFWEEIRNFLANCVYRADGEEDGHATETLDERSLAECEVDYWRLKKISENWLSKTNSVDRSKAIDLFIEMKNDKGHLEL